MLSNNFLRFRIAACVFPIWPPNVGTFFLVGFFVDLDFFFVVMIFLLIKV